VYVLLLGPRYGAPFPDTGLSPTADEFPRARQRGIPVLVFNKTVDAEDEQAQVDFNATRSEGRVISSEDWALTTLRPTLRRTT
jgi:hypothetical protein